MLKYGVFHIPYTSRMWPRTELYSVNFLLDKNLTEEEAVTTLNKYISEATSSLAELTGVRNANFDIWNYRSVEGVVKRAFSNDDRFGFIVFNVNRYPDEGPARRAFNKRLRRLGKQYFTVLNNIEVRSRS